jgi:hypothetical protein
METFPSPLFQDLYDKFQGDPGILILYHRAFVMTADCMPLSSAEDSSILVPRVSLERLEKVLALQQSSP